MMKYSILIDSSRIAITFSLATSRRIRSIVSTKKIKIIIFYGTPLYTDSKLPIDICTPEIFNTNIYCNFYLYIIIYNYCECTNSKGYFGVLNASFEISRYTKIKPNCQLQLICNDAFKVKISHQMTQILKLNKYQ